MRCSRRKYCSRTGILQQDEDLSRSQSCSRTEWAAGAGGGAAVGGGGAGGKLVAAGHGGGDDRGRARLKCSHGG